MKEVKNDVALYKEGDTYVSYISSQLHNCHPLMCFNLYGPGNGTAKHATRLGEGAGEKIGSGGKQRFVELLNSKNIQVPTCPYRRNSVGCTKLECTACFQ